MSEANKKVPRWVTAWPEWFGIRGNVSVVPASDYELLESELQKYKIKEKTWREIANQRAIEVADLTVKKPKFENVSCSQCGQDFGPGDHGFSHCADHAGLHRRAPRCRRRGED